jgi:hypothetical protein
MTNPDFHQLYERGQEEARRRRMTPGDAERSQCVKDLKLAVGFLGATIMVLGGDVGQLVRRSEDAEMVQVVRRLIEAVDQLTAQLQQVVDDVHWLGLTDEQRARERALDEQDDEPGRPTDE